MNWIPTAKYAFQTPDRSSVSPFGGGPNVSPSVVARNDSPDIVVGTRAWVASLGGFGGLGPDRAREALEFGYQFFESPTGYGVPGRPIRPPRTLVIDPAIAGFGDDIASAVSPLLAIGVSVYLFGGIAYRYTAAGFLPIVGTDATPSGAISANPFTYPNEDGTFNIDFTAADLGKTSGGRLMVVCRPATASCSLKDPAYPTLTATRNGAGWAVSPDGSTGYDAARARRYYDLLRSYYSQSCTTFQSRVATNNPVNDYVESLALSTIGETDVLSDLPDDGTPARAAARISRIVEEALPFFAG